MIHDLLPLERPVIALDLETTGIHKKVDRIVQIGIIKVSLDGTMNEWQTLVNPTIPIPAEASAVHGITNEMVKDARKFAEMARGLAAGFAGCDFCGYNVSFDLGILESEFQRCQVPFNTDHRILDAFKIFQRFEPRNLEAAVKQYLDEELEGAHDALIDVRATLRVLRAQLLKYDTLPRTVEGLHQMFFAAQPGQLDSDGKITWRDNFAVLNFGKHAGQKLQDIPKQYLQYLLKPEFTSKPDFKKIIEEAVQGRFPEKKA